MRKLLIAVLAVCVFGSAAADENQAQARPGSTQSISVDEVSSLMRDQAAARRVVAMRLAPIRSDRDMQAYIRSNANSPLGASRRALASDLSKV